MIRTYGKTPYHVAVIHGGPGAPGYMAPVARALSTFVGVMEPLQSKLRLSDQVTELEAQLLEKGTAPFCLIGSSWGANLALFVAARQKVRVGKLILIGSGTFDLAGSEETKKRRADRIGEAGRRRVSEIRAQFEKNPTQDQSALLSEMADLFFTADVFAPLTRDLETLEVQQQVNQNVYADFKVLRDEPGRLKRELSSITCPVTVIHGDYDPHPIEAIRSFLESTLRQTTFFVIPECGHYPWIERGAKDVFYERLIREIKFL